jgi:DNA-binding response OmpR family regulator
VAFVDGGEAVSWIENVDQGRVRGELPELAILDIRLPEVSGPEVGSRLRRSPTLKDMAIVLITAYRLSPEEEEAVIAQAQADLLMYKPLPTLLELREKMDAVIGRHKKLPPPAEQKDQPEDLRVLVLQAPRPTVQESDDQNKIEVVPASTPPQAESSESPEDTSSQEAE